jgi:hypothetical protein
VKTGSFFVFPMCAGAKETSEEFSADEKTNQNGKRRENGAAGKKIRSNFKIHKNVFCLLTFSLVRAILNL